METIHIRGSLKKFRSGIQNGEVSIGFAGGSITTAQTPSNWPTHLKGWLASEFPHVKFRINNAAIGATGSLCGLALAQKEFIDYGCDIVFVEYAVNDHSVDRDERMRTREGLIRKLLAANIDVVLVYTYFSEMYDGNVDALPQSIADFEQLAEHYNISSVYMAKAVYNMVSGGVLPMHMWLPDGTHPQELGSYLYAAEVRRFLTAELVRRGDMPILGGEHLPEAINAGHWQNAAEIPFDAVQTLGTWCIEKERALSWFNEKLYTCAFNASVSIPFSGRGIAIIFNYGKTTGIIEYRIDNGEWQKYAFERYWWVPEENFVNAVKFFDNLANGEHLFELRVSYTNQKDFTSCTCGILKIMVV